MNFIEKIHLQPVVNSLASYEVVERAKSTLKWKPQTSTSRARALWIQQHAAILGQCQCTATGKPHRSDTQPAITQEANAITSTHHLRPAHRPRISSQTPSSKCELCWRNYGLHGGASSERVRGFFSPAFSLRVWWVAAARARCWSSRWAWISRLQSARHRWRWSAASATGPNEVPHQSPSFLFFFPDDCWWVVNVLTLANFRFQFIPFLCRISMDSDAAQWHESVSKFKPPSVAFTSRIHSTIISNRCFHDTFVMLVIFSTKFIF